MSDGSFSRSDGEIACIREVVKDKIKASCTCAKGCVLCCPPITFVICQSQHNTRMVPASKSEGFAARGGTNVHR